MGGGYRMKKTGNVPQACHEQFVIHPWGYAKDYHLVSHSHAPVKHG